MLWLSWLGFISTPWQLFFMDLGSTLRILALLSEAFFLFHQKYSMFAFESLSQSASWIAKFRNPKPFAFCTDSLPFSPSWYNYLKNHVCFLMCQCIIYFIKPKSCPQTSLILSFLYLVLPVWNFHEISHLVFLETLCFKCRRFLRHTLKNLRGPSICLKVYIWVTLLNLSDVLTKAVTHQPGFDLFPEVISQFLI